MKLFSPALLRCVLGLGLGLLAFSAFGRQGKAPLSVQKALVAAVTAPPLVLPPVDAAAEQAADAKAGAGGPMRFAVPVPVTVTPATHGEWTQLPEGRLWRLRVTAAGATDLNFAFTTFWLPEGATLHVGAANEAYFQGPYTARDHKPHGELWTPLLPGESAWIELFVPATAPQEPRLALTQVGCGYRDWFHRRNGLSQPKAGSCNVDVKCPAASPWGNEIRSAAVYSISGSFSCSGTMVMNAQGDFRNYFLTANHCGLNAGNAPSVVVYWNFQSPTCGQHGGGSLAQNQSGATFRASRTDADFALIELDDVPEAAFGVHYAGWDRATAAPPGAVGIHHPNTDEKSISFASNALFTIDSCITAGTSTHWDVTWNLGVTEPGSSGSGLWNSANHRLVGVLSGGDSSCSRPNDSDCYGKFNVAWNGSSSASRLSDWLDPQNSGVTSLAGSDPSPVPSIISAGAFMAAEGCTPANGVLDAGETVTVNFSLRNTGTTNTTSLIATLLATNGVTAPGGPQNYGALLANGAAVSRPFTFSASTACGGIITTTLRLQDGASNLPPVLLNFRVGTPSTALAQNFDGVTAPVLPSGWTAAAIEGAALPWATSASLRDTLPNSAFAAAPSDIEDNRLTSPAFTIISNTAQFSFRHQYAFEGGFDGGVLEISINGGGFTDILAAGGSFAGGGYTGTLSGAFDNPLAGRTAWTGSSGGFITTTVQLPVAATGASVRFRWRLGTDDSVGATGWAVDSVQIIDGYVCCRNLVPPALVNPRKVAPGGFAFSYASIFGQTYFVEGKTNVTGTNWSVLATNSGDGSTKSFTNSAGAPRQIYRLRTQ